MCTVSVTDDVIQWVGGHLCRIETEKVLLLAKWEEPMAQIGYMRVKALAIHT